MKTYKPVPNFIAKIMYFNHSPKRLKKEIKLINSGILKQGYKVLDIGCGTGYLSIEMSRIVADSGEVFAMDIHPLAIKAMDKEIHDKYIKNIKTILTNNLESGLTENYLDVIFVINSYDMIKDKRKLHFEISHLLKPGGRLIICNRINLQTRKGKIKKIFSDNDLMFFEYNEKNTFYFKKKKER